MKNDLGNIKGFLAVKWIFDIVVPQFDLKKNGTNIIHT
jgi:hypothetical protein